MRALAIMALFQALFYPDARATRGASPRFFRNTQEAAMIGKNALHRRALVGSLGIAGLTVALPALARDEVKKGSDDVMTPAEILSRNSAVLQRVMLVYETGIRRSTDGEDIDPTVFVQCAEVARDFFHNFHEKAEQDLVYPVFTKTGRMVDLVNALSAQQGEGRKLTDRIIDEAPKVHAKEQRDTLAGDIKSFIDLYRPHIAREETDIFPTLHNLMTGDEYGRMATELLKRETAAFGPEGGFEAAIKKVAQVEAKIGMHDLAEAPPKK
jgi:hemerythrin-like domain-containing protein